MGAKNPSRWQWQQPQPGGQELLALGTMQGRAQLRQRTEQAVLVGDAPDDADAMMMQN